MTSHKLAAQLMLLPDLPVVINGWGSCEGTPFEISGVNEREITEFCPDEDGANVGCNVKTVIGPAITLSHR